MLSVGQQPTKALYSSSLPPLQAGGVKCRKSFFCLLLTLMPQLDKFTYFTQFFWSCLFLFTFYISSKKYFLPFHLEIKLSCFYLKSKHLQQMIFWLKWIFIVFILVRTSFLLVHNFWHLFFQSTYSSIRNKPPWTLSESSASGPGMGWICEATPTNPKPFTQGVRGHGARLP